MLYLKNKIKDRSISLSAALDRVEQAAQAIRWRIANDSEDYTVMGEEVAALCCESAQVATIFGELSAIRGLEVHAKRDEVCTACGQDKGYGCENCSVLVCEDCTEEYVGRVLCDYCMYMATAAEVASPLEGTSDEPPSQPEVEGEVGHTGELNKERNT